MHATIEAISIFVHEDSAMYGTEFVGEDRHPYFATWHPSFASKQSLRCVSDDKSLKSVHDVWGSQQPLPCRYRCRVVELITTHPVALHCLGKVFGCCISVWMVARSMLNTTYMVEIWSSLSPEVPETELIR